MRVKNNILKAILTLWVAILLNEVCAQQNFSKEYSSLNGLISSDNYISLQDKKGYIWISSDKGIVKFDGVTFKYFTVKDGLPINDIWYMKEDSQGRIWLGGFFKGLYYIKNDKIHKHNKGVNHYNLLFNTEKNDTLFFYEDREKRTFYLSPKGEFKTFMINNTLSIKLDDNIIAQNDVINKSTVVFFNNFNKKITVKNYLHTYRTIQAMHKNYMPLHDRGKWVIWNKNNIKEVTPSTYFGGKLSQATTILPSGYLVLRVNKKIRVYKDLITKERDSILEKKLSAFNNEKISWIMQDKEKNLWLTMYRSNIVFIPNFNHYINRYYNSIPKKGNSFSDMIISPHKTTLLSLRGRIYEYDNVLKTINPTATNRVVNIQKRRNNKVVFIKRNSIILNDKNIKKTFFIQNSTNNITSKCGKLINDSTFITGNLKKYKLKNNLAYLILDSNSINSRIISLAITKKYYLSGGTEGLFVTNRNTNSQKHFKFNSVKTSKIYNNNLLVGTNGQGLIYMSLEGKIFFNAFLDLTINNIAVKDGLVYLATNKGIHIIKIKNKKYQLIKVINNKMGLSSNEVTSIKFKKEIMYATTVDGFNTIDIHSLLTKKNNPPSIHLEKTLVNGKEKEKRNFKWNENNVEFIYAGISYFSMGEINYQYRLKGINDKWLNTNKNSIQFPKLPYGKYTFELKAINSQNVSSIKTIQYSFYIEKHFTQTWWFKSSILLLLIGIFGGFIYLYQKRKIDILTTKKQFANLEMRALQSQMNPHFLFNSLNAIQSVMFLKGEEEANRYIGTFSKLMRTTLDNSKKSKILLQDEIEYLTLYLESEKNRLDNNLTFEVSIIGDLNVENILLPSMLFQPLVENAIIHGLIPKKNNRNLLIEFTIDDNLLIGMVSDNGIGRKKANQNQQKDYKSWASTILKEKIDVLNRINPSKISFTIIDIEENGNPKGTKTIIKLPLEYEN